MLEIHYGSQLPETKVYVEDVTPKLLNKLNWLVKMTVAQIKYLLLDKKVKLGLLDLSQIFYFAL